MHTIPVLTLGNQTWGLTVMDDADPADLPPQFAQFATDTAEILKNAPATAVPAAVSANQAAIAANTALAATDTARITASHREIGANIRLQPSTFLIKVHFTNQHGNRVIRAGNAWYLHLHKLRNRHGQFINYTPVDNQVTSYGGSGGQWNFQAGTYGAKHNEVNVGVVCNRDFTLGAGGRDYYWVLQTISPGVRGSHDLWISHNTLEPVIAEPATPEDAMEGEGTAEQTEDGVFSFTF